MKKKNAIVLVSSAVAAMSLMGCFTAEHYHDGEGVIVEQNPAYVIVTEAPPAPRIVERRPAPPSKAHIWIEAHYSWNGRQYISEPGRWERPPRENVVWIGPSYDRDEHGYRYTPGHWKPQDR